MLDRRLSRLGIFPVRFHLVAQSSLRLPVYKGALFRGGFGQFFRRVACQTGAESCNGCPQISTCPYSVVFETPVIPGQTPLLRKYPYAPHPFVLVPPLDSCNVIPAGTEFLMGITLIGAGAGYLAHFIGAIGAMGRSGAYGGFFKVNGVQSAVQGGGVIYDGRNGRLISRPQAWRFSGPSCKARRATVHLLTPLRLRSRGQYEQWPTFVDFAKGLLGRLHLLTALYSGCPIDRAWLRPLLAYVDTLRTERRSFRVFRWGRRSGRSGRWVAMDGILGSLTVAGELSPLIPALEAGQWLHVGSGTSMGLGKYAVEYES